ncbi:MAG: hypothetical protein QM589_02475 [Thermomicrobiales bacterium]
MIRLSPVVSGGSRIAIVAIVVLGFALATPVSAQNTNLPDGDYETEGGTTIAWSDAWETSLAMTGVEEEQGFGAFEMLAFEPADDNACATIYCGLSIVVYDARNADAQDVEEAYVTTKLAAKGTNVLLDGDANDTWWALLQTGTGDSAQTIMSYTTRIDDEVFAITLTADAGAIVDYLDSAQGSISVDGDELFAAVDVGDVEDAL